MGVAPAFAALGADPHALLDVPIALLDDPLLEHHRVGDAVFAEDVGVVDAPAEGIGQGAFEPRGIEPEALVEEFDRVRSVAHAVGFSVSGLRG